MFAGPLILAILCCAAVMTSCRQVEYTISFYLVQQRTSAGKQVGQPILLGSEVVFHKNDLISIQLEIPQTGYLYAFQADDQGSYDVLYPSASGSPPVMAGARLRLPAEQEQWMGFIDSSVRVAWSPRRIESLEKAIDNSEVEEEGIRAIREPKEVADLQRTLQQLGVSTKREIVPLPSPRSILRSTSEVICFQIDLAVD